MKLLSEQIREAIQQSGVTPYVLARDAGISDSVLSRFLNGSGGLTLKTLDALAAVMGWEITQTVQRTSLPKKRGRKPTATMTTNRHLTRKEWQSLASRMAMEANTKHFWSERGVWVIDGAMALCVYDNHPSERRPEHLKWLRSWLKTNSVKELGFATYTERDLPPDCTYAMIIGCGADRIDELVDQIRKNMGYVLRVSLGTKFL